MRSYRSGLFEFEPGVNIVVGPNASGKTNLLEAIHMAARGSAFKSDDSDMIARDAEWARIDAQVDDHLRTVKLTPQGKAFVADGVEKKRLAADKMLPTVLFEPSQLMLLGGEPERRRAYLDTLLTQTELGYEPLLKDYKRTLSQRNRLLKQDTVSPEHVFVWDVRLSDLAGQIVDLRLRYVELLQGQITDNYRSVSGNDETLDIRYESKLSTDHYANAMLAKLKDSFVLDRARGFTGVGPHRDDLVVLLNGNDARQSASRGETRSIVLALKLTELEVVESKTGVRPLLLLDDVFSELDGKRRRMLATTLQEYQTFITTTDADVVIDHFSKTCNIIPL